MASNIELGATYRDKLTRVRGVAIEHTEFLDATGVTVLLCSYPDKHTELTFNDMRLELDAAVPVVDLTDPEDE